MYSGSWKSCFCWQKNNNFNFTIWFSQLHGVLRIWLFLRMTVGNFENCSPLSSCHYTVVSVGHAHVPPVIMHCRWSVESCTRRRTTERCAFGVWTRRSALAQTSHWPETRDQCLVRRTSRPDRQRPSCRCRHLHSSVTSPSHPSSPCLSTLSSPPKMWKLLHNME